MQKKIFLFCVFSLGIFISFAQLPDKKTKQTDLDTALIKNRIVEFTRLVFSKSSPDSIIKFPPSPVFTKKARRRSVLRDDM